MDMRKALLPAAALLAGPLLLPLAANAVEIEILAFGESDANGFVVTNPTASTTHIASTAIPVSVTFIDATPAIATPFNATFTMSADNMGASSIDGTGTLHQAFTGSFSITSATCGGNCLSGTFTDLVA